MALVPVRSKQPINGERFLTEVGEEHLERWPDDYERLEGEELARYQARKAGVGEEHLDDAVAAALAATAVTDEHGDEPGDAVPTPGDEEPVTESTPTGEVSPAPADPSTPTA